jgi:hypothetical protein
MRTHAVDAHAMQAVLSRWRATERDLDALGHDSAAADDLRALADELRDEYQRLLAEELEGTGLSHPAQGARRIGPN